MRPVPKRIATAALTRIESSAARKMQSRVTKAFSHNKPADAEPDVDRRELRVQAVAGVDAIKARRLLGGESPANILSGDKLCGAERLIGETADFLPVSFLSVGQATALAVGRVIQRNGQPVGTGFLISGELFLTNNHVISSRDEARGMLLEFDYETDVHGQPRGTTRFSLDDDKFFLTNDKDDLDYTVVAVGDRVTGEKMLSEFGFCPLSDRGDKHMLGEFVNIIQHPEGNFKQVVLRENKLVSRLDTVLHYEADTQPGSSGSAVFNDEWEAVALHHWGGPHREQRTRDGEPVPAAVNEGIRISAIVKELFKSQTELSKPQKDLLNVVLNGKIGRRDSNETSISNVNASEAETPRFHAINIPDVQMNPNGSVTVSVEIKMRVSGGQGRRSKREGTNKSEALSSFSTTSLSANVFDWRMALSTVLASQLAYSDEAAIKERALNDWGLSNCRFVSLDDTQSFIASVADTALVVFRGSESVGDWLANFDIQSTTRPYGLLHRGFFRAFEDVQDQILQALSTLNSKRVIVTGHSLGGAIATVFAAEAPANLPIKWIYTYGQPCVGIGNDYTAALTDRYGKTLVRFVNDDDIVPRLPPSPYRHVGRLVHFSADGDVGGDPERLAVGAGIADGPPLLTEDEFERLQSQLRSRIGIAKTDLAEGLFPSFSDHAIAQYISKIEKNA